MKNDCSLHPANPSSSILIRDVFAKSFTIQFSIIATVAAGNETVNNKGGRINSIQSTLAVTGATAVNNNVTTIYGKEVNNGCDVTVDNCNEAVNVNHVMVAHRRVMANANDVMPNNSGSNMVCCSCNEDQLSLQYASMFVVTRFNVHVIRFSIVVIRINVSNNPIFHRCNTHQCSYQYGTMFVYWPTLLVYSPTKQVFSITASKKYDTPIVQPPSISIAA